MNDDSISRKAALDCVTYDEEYTIERIKALPPLQSTCNKLATDVISRQVAIDAMCELMHHWFGCDSKDEIREIKRELGKLPSEQQNIIRCEDCEHYIPYDWMFGGLSKSNDINKYSPDDMVCLINDSNYPPDGFCSKAERRTT